MPLEHYHLIQAQLCSTGPRLTWPVVADYLPALLGMIELAICGCNTSCITNGCRCKKNGYCALMYANAKTKKLPWIASWWLPYRWLSPKWLRRRKWWWRWMTHLYHEIINRVCLSTSWLLILSYSSYIPVYSNKYLLKCNSVKKITLN